MAAQLDAKTLERLAMQVEAPHRMGEHPRFAHCCAFIIENGYMNAETIRLDAATRLSAAENSSGRRVGEFNLAENS